MPRNRLIKAKVTKNQFDRIKLNAQAKGFKTIAGYLRHLSLEYNQYLEAKIIENNKILKEISDAVKEK